MFIINADGDIEEIEKLGVNFHGALPIIPSELIKTPYWWYYSSSCYDKATLRFNYTKETGRHTTGIYLVGCNNYHGLRKIKFERITPHHIRAYCAPPLFSV